MGETSKYHLYVTDDKSTLFSEWRDKMNGEANSNMTKIDEALGEKADESVAVTATLTKSGWTGTQSPYTQVLSVAGVTAESNGSIAVAQSANADERKAARAGVLSVSAQGDGTITVIADGEKPDKNIPVVIILLG